MKKRMFSNAQLRRLIFPLLIEQLLAMLVGMVDTRLLSEFWLPMLLIFILIPAVVAVVVLLLIKRNIGRR